MIRLSRHLPLLFLLLLAYPVAGQTSRSIATSMGVWPFLIGQVDPQADRIIQQCKNAGLDTIYLHVWSTRGSRRGRLRMRDEAGTWNRSFGAPENQVTVSSFISKAHRAGLQVVAVVQCYDKSALPNNAAHNRFLTQTLLRYLVHSYKQDGSRHYPFDGICFDYVRWFGGNHTSSEVDAFLDAARKEVGPLPLHAYVIAGGYVFDGPVYNANFNSYQHVRSYLIRNHGQDWESMARKIDVLLPMAYTANGHIYGSNTGHMQAYLKTVSSYARQAVNRAGSKCRIAPAIRLWNDSRGTTTRATVEACASGALLGGADGFSGFRWGTAQNQSSWWAGMAKHSQAGPDLPIAAWSTSLSGRNLLVDSRASRSSVYSQAQLTARYDLDGDGVFELGPFPLGSRTLALPGVGPRTVRLELRDPRGGRDLVARRLSVPGNLTPFTQNISASKGGNASWNYAAGFGAGRQLYLTLITLSGSSPGTLLPDQRRIPINFDGLSYLGLLTPNSPPFVRFIGNTNLFGGANPAFIAAPKLLPSTLVGTKLHVACLLFRRDLSGIEKISTVAETRILP
ncbi:MAG: hypothetical protein CSA62_03795 [Planctomycetota bacterium]|nr:MAG: hypothetical protein CSA62_03795 [Planctomycetota bacterium]